MTYPTVVEAGAEETHCTLAEGMRVNDSRKHRLHILHETMTGTP